MVGRPPRVSISPLAEDIRHVALPSLTNSCLRNSRGVIIIVPLLAVNRELLSWLANVLTEIDLFNDTFPFEFVRVIKAVPFGGINISISLRLR